MKPILEYLYNKKGAIKSYSTWCCDVIIYTDFQTQALLKVFTDFISDSNKYLNSLSQRKDMLLFLNNHYNKIGLWSKCADYKRIIDISKKDIDFVYKKYNFPSDDPNKIFALGIYKDDPDFPEPLEYDAIIGRDIKDQLYCIEK